MGVTTLNPLSHIVCPMEVGAVVEGTFGTSGVVTLLN